MTFMQWILGDQTFVDLVDKISEQKDVNEFARQVRIRAAGGEDAIKQRSAKVQQLQKGAEEKMREAAKGQTNSELLYESALEDLKEVAEMRGCWNKSSLQSAVEILNKLKRFEECAGYCYVASVVYRWPSFSEYFPKSLNVLSIDLANQLFEPLLPEKSLFALFGLLRNQVMHEFSVPFIETLLLKLETSWMIEHSDFSKLNLDQQFAWLALILIYKTVDRSDRFVDVATLKGAPLNLMKTAFSEGAFSKVAKAEPGAFDYFYDTIFSTFHDAWEKVPVNKLPDKFIDFSWYARAGLMFAFCDLSHYSEISGLLKMSFMLQDKLFTSLNGKNEDLSKMTSHYAAQDVARMITACDLFTLAQALGFADVMDYAPSELRNRKIKRRRFSIGFSFHGAIRFLTSLPTYPICPCDQCSFQKTRGSVLKQIFISSLNALKLQMVKQLHIVVEASTLKALIDLHVDASLNFTLSISVHETKALLNLSNCEPFWHHLLSASRILLATKRFQDESSVSKLKQMWMIFRCLAYQYPEIFKRRIVRNSDEFNYNRLLMCYYSEPIAFECIPVMLQSVSPEQMTNISQGSSFHPAVLTFWLTLIDSLGGMQGLSRDTINAARSLNAIHRAKAASLSKALADLGVTFKGLHNKLSQFMRKHSAAFWKRVDESEVIYCRLAIAAVGILMATLCEVDGEMRKLFVVKKNDRLETLDGLKDNLSILSSMK